ncbi:MAG TPA: hypothetical protein VFD84_20530 [Candidatus Binatia bacterium]|nr:hypothetical protein [Candidatus Binatia bacterium]
MMQELWRRMHAAVTDVRSLRRRTTALVVLHLVLVAACVAVLVLVVVRIRLLVTLAQRSNVETLTLAFVLVFTLYLLASTAPAVWGGLRLLGARALGREREQRWLQRRVEQARRDTKRVYLNVVVEPPGGGPLDLPIEDGWGRVGALRLDGSEVALVDVPEQIVNSPLALAVVALATIGTVEGTDSRPQIVAWGNVDEEGAEQYGSQVRAFQRLGEALGRTLWPVVRLDEAGVAHLRGVIREAAAELREDMLLPDIEYSAEFTIPIIPEPLALMQVRREQKHADPVATLGCATLVVLAMLGALGWLVLRPPWVPGK